MAKRKAKTKIPKFDGLDVDDVKRIRNALRAQWRYSHQWKLVANRCVGPDGFSVCEKCLKKAPKVFVDHIIPCGDVDGGYIERLFTPSCNLQGLCKKCHDAKTNKEKSDKKKKDKNKPSRSRRYIPDFY